MEAYVNSNFIEKGIVEIEFFHPQSNSLPASILQQIADSINKLNEEKDIQVIILKSSGEKAFCAGASFDELIAIDDEQKGLEFFSGFAKVINACRKSNKIILGRIQAKAVGGGVGIASACDYVFAHENASIKLSELAVGIGPFVVGPAVQRKIGLAAFSQMALQATLWYDALWAKENGLYAELFSSLESLDAALLQFARTLSQSNPQALQDLKKIFWDGTENWDNLLIERAKVSGRLVLSEFTKNAINNFKKK